MATITPTSVKDVPRDMFITAYAEHLKANDKVCSYCHVTVSGLIAARCATKKPTLASSPFAAGTAVAHISVLA
jgi:hypothetical protein